jgi:hypothetical protein
MFIGNGNDVYEILQSRPECVLSLNGEAGIDTFMLSFLMAVASDGSLEYSKFG